jgi:hypothetical protein
VFDAHGHADKSEDSRLKDSHNITYGLFYCELIIGGEIN